MTPAAETVIEISRYFEEYNLRRARSGLPPVDLPKLEAEDEGHVLATNLAGQWRITTDPLEWRWVRYGVFPVAPQPKALGDLIAALEAFRQLSSWLHYHDGVQGKTK